MDYNFKNYLKLVPSLILILLIYKIVVSIIHTNKSKDRILSIEKDIDIKLEENKNLVAELEYAKSEEFIRKNAIDKLNLTKPNEKILIIPTKPVENQGGQDIKEPLNSSEKPIWTAWATRYKLINIITKSGLYKF